MTELRRLAAISVADVAGYSKLIGRDEAGTLAQRDNAMWIGTDGPYYHLLV